MTVRDYFPQAGSRWRRAALGVGLVLTTVASSVLTGAPARADSVRDAQWPNAALRLTEAHKISQGEGVTVAVVDTGVDGNHPDLVGNVLKGTSVVAAGGDGWSDPVPHGTSVASVIAGHGHGAGNGDGVLGVAPKAKILPVSVYAKRDGGIPGLTTIAPADIATGIFYAVDHGAKVISVALVASPDKALEEAVLYAISKNVLVIAGAGNEAGESIAYPALYPGVVGVSGSTRAGGFDERLTWGRHVRIAAPSADVPVANPGGQYATSSGSSLSTGYAAGTAALIRAKYPNIDVLELRRRLLHSAVDKGEPGFDSKFGYGIIDPVAALAPTVPNRDPSPVPSDVPTTKKYVHVQSKTTTADAMLGLAILAVPVLVIGLIVWLVLRARSRRRRAAAQSGPPVGFGVPGSAPSQVGPGQPPHGAPGQPPHTGPGQPSPDVPGQAPHAGPGGQDEEHWRRPSSP